MDIFTILILFTLIGGIIVQFSISFFTYIASLLFSIFSRSLRDDFLSIKLNPFNQNTDKVMQSKYFSFYKGVFVIKTSIKRPCSVCMLVMNHKKNEYFETILKHEYGHIFQQMILGPIKYLLLIGIPSSLQLSKRSYYCRPWESTADCFGRVVPEGKHRKTRKDNIIGFSYLAVSALLGPIAFFYLLNEYKNNGA